MIFDQFPGTHVFIDLSIYYYSFSLYNDCVLYFLFRKGKAENMHLRRDCVILTCRIVVGEFLVFGFLQSLNFSVRKTCSRAFNCKNTKVLFSCVDPEKSARLAEGRFVGSRMRRDSVKSARDLL